MSPAESLRSPERESSEEAASRSSEAALEKERPRAPRSEKEPPNPRSLLERKIELGT
jgi:hypothetical protein